VAFCFFFIFFSLAQERRKVLIGTAAETHGHFLKYIPSLEESAKCENTSICMFKSVHAFKEKTYAHW